MFNDRSMTLWSEMIKCASLTSILPVPSHPQSLHTSCSRTPIWLNEVERLLVVCSGLRQNVQHNPCFTFTEKLMAKERDVIAILFKNFFKSFLPRKFSGELRGSDHMGNQYYEISSQNRNKASRYFTPIGGEAGFDKEIPAEWEAWLRGRRSQPPTETEVLNNYRLMLEKKKNAAEIDAKFKGVKQENLLPPDMKGMRSFPEYKDYEIMPGKKPDNENK